MRFCVSALQLTGDLVFKILERTNEKLRVQNRPKRKIATLVGQKQFLFGFWASQKELCIDSQDTYSPGKIWESGIVRKLRKAQKSQGISGMSLVREFSFETRCSFSELIIFLPDWGHQDSCYFDVVFLQNVHGKPGNVTQSHFIE